MPRQTSSDSHQLSFTEIPFAGTDGAKKKQKRTKKAASPPSIPAIIQSARKIMRKDKGLNGELDRLPALTWIMLLKFLDDKEREWEAEAELEGRSYRPVIEPPYRWRDWAAPEDGITGEKLLAFIEQDRTVLPDGSEGLGLLAYLRSLSGSDLDRQRVVAEVFEGVRNRMESGHLLRDVINLVGGIHFTVSKEVQALGLVYESMLREMRDAAGDSGEFYTPRPVVKFMVDRIDPTLGETVLDPACGTGGFLVAAYEHLQAQARTAEDWRLLEDGAIQGNEAKSLPYMLCQMNLLLHGLGSPRIRRGNSLEVQLTQLGDRDRVDIIVTNPPFGGEEEARILNGFPAERQTRETALLFLQLIMRLLRRPISGQQPGRAAVVVPNGTLFADGVANRIKEDLLKEYNLHTIVRLPDGAFAPYTDIPANLLFFDRSGPTETIWYYELEKPEGRKKYSKTKPIRDEDFAACIAWWSERTENAQAWRYEFRQAYSKAVEEATPFRAAATEAEIEAARCAERSKGLTVEIRSLEATLAAGLTLADAERAAVTARLTSMQAERDALQEQERAYREQAAEATARADAIYWPIYNLDQKNPHAGEAIEHRSPEELVESILQKETRILDLIHEIKVVLGGYDE